MNVENRFIYRARKMNGQLVKGEVFAGDLDEAKKKVRGQGLIIVEIDLADSQSTLSVRNLDWKSVSESFEKVSDKELMLFTQQLQTIYSVGIPLVDGLSLMSDQFESRKMKEVTTSIINDISNGNTLSSAMSKHRRVFDEIYISMVEVGEASGQLENILLKLYTTIEARNQNRNRVKSAMFYPKMVVGMIVVVFVVMTTYVIPKLKAFYASMGASDLPLPTRIVLGTSNFVVNNFFLLLAFSILSYWSFQRWLKTPKGALTWDSLKLKMPIVGPLLRDIEMNSVCTILEMLVRSGLGIVQSLEVLKGTLTNQLVRQDIENCRVHTLGGGRIGDSLKSSKTFPKMLSGLISIGEEAGALETILNRTGRYYQEQVEYKVNNLSKAIEPILLGITFGFVLLLALAIFLPIWNMASLIKK